MVTLVARSALSLTLSRRTMQPGTSKGLGVDLKKS